MQPTAETFGMNFATRPKSGPWNLDPWTTTFPP